MCALALPGGPGPGDLSESPGGLSAPLSEWFMLLKVLVVLVVAVPSWSSELAFDKIVNGSIFSNHLQNSIWAQQPPPWHSLASPCHRNLPSSPHCPCTEALTAKTGSLDQRPRRRISWPVCPSWSPTSWSSNTIWGKSIKTLTNTTSMMKFNTLIRKTLWTSARTSKLQRMKT